MRTYRAILLSALMSVSRVLADEYGSILKSYGESVHIAGLGQLQDTNGCCGEEGGSR
jgi:hypothetical protein